MKILVIAPHDFNVIDGTAVRVYNHVKALCASSAIDEVLLVSYGGEEAFRCFDKVVNMRIKVVKLWKSCCAAVTPFRRIVLPMMHRDVIEEIKRFRDLIKDVDIIHVHFHTAIPLAMTIMYALKLKVPIVCDVHGLPRLQPLLYHGLKSVVCKKREEIVQELVFRGLPVSVFAVPTPAIKRYIVNKYHHLNNRVIVVPDALWLTNEQELVSYIESVERSRCDTCKRLNPDGKIIIAYVGNPSYYHGFEDFLRAVMYVSRKFDRIKLLLVLPDKARAEHIANLISRTRVGDTTVFYSVERWRLHQLLGCANVLVLPHRSGSQFDYLYSNKLLDYIITGKPIVSYKLASVKEVLDKYPLKVYAQPNNPIDLAKQILNAIKTYGDSTAPVRTRVSILEPYLLKNITSILTRTYKLLKQHR